MMPASVSAREAARYDVQYVVTEFGAAELWGKTLAQRAEALISVAHPRFRDELRRKQTEGLGNFGRGT